MTELAPVLTWCHVCQSPFVETIKATEDLSSLVCEYVHIAVQDGLMMPTLAEGLRAQEMIDR